MNVGYLVKDDPIGDYDEVPGLLVASGGGTRGSFQDFLDYSFMYRLVSIFPYASSGYG